MARAGTAWVGDDVGPPGVGVAELLDEPPGQLAVRLDRRRELSLQVGSRGLQHCVVEAVGVQSIECRQREVDRLCGRFRRRE